MSIHSHVVERGPLSTQVAVLGPLQIGVEGQWEAVSTRQVARLTTILAGWPGELVERERLVEGMWGDQAPNTVSNTLQAHVSQLRRIVGKETVQCQGTSYRLDVPPHAVDAENFAELVMDAARMRRKRHYGRAVELLTAAKELWRGIPYPDVLDPDLQARRARLEEMHEQASEDLLESRLELCRDTFDLAEVIAAAKEMVSRHPLREKAHIVLVRALAAADRPGEAGAAFEEAARHLRSTMGLDPGRVLVDVHTKGLHRDPQILPHAMRTISVLPSNGDHTADPELIDVAQRVRETVTDLGARVVTVVEKDTDRAEALALVAARALRPDAGFGVMVTHGPDISSRALSKDFGPAIGDEDFDITTFDKAGGLVLVVVNGGSQLRKLLKSLGRWSAEPTVIAIGPQVLDIDTEVIVDGHESANQDESQGSRSSGASSRAHDAFFSRMGA